MGLKFKNRLHVSVQPRVWVSPTGKRIAWRSDITMFGTFVGIVQDYCRENKITPPTEEELEDLLCRQSSPRDCTGDPRYHQPAGQRPVPNTSSGCSSCGGGR